VYLHDHPVRVVYLRVLEAGVLGSIYSCGNAATIYSMTSKAEARPPARGWACQRDALRHSPRRCRLGPFSRVDDPVWAAQGPRGGTVPSVPRRKGRASGLPMVGRLFPRRAFTEGQCPCTSPRSFANAAQLAAGRAQTLYCRSNRRFPGSIQWPEACWCWCC
jgi:hypothetical protein